MSQHTPSLSFEVFPPNPEVAMPNSYVLGKYAGASSSLY